MNSVDSFEGYIADKEKSADRIDGPVAMIMAIGRAVLVPEDEVAPDVYTLGSRF